MKTPEPTGEYVRQPHSPYPTQAEFLEKLSYDPLTGEIRWREGKVRAAYRNPVFLGPGNMPVIRWGRRTFQAIKVAYVMHTGDNTIRPHHSVMPRDADMLNFKADNLVGDPHALDPIYTAAQIKANSLKYDAWATAQKAAKARRQSGILQVPRFNDPRPSSRTKAKPLPPVEDLRANFRYDPETGHLYWKHGYRPTNSPGRVPGTIAGTRNPNGYIKVRLGKYTMSAHRVAWAIFHGEDPGLRLVDHKDRDPSNNRISNLRIANHAQNSHNSSRKPKGRSGVKGVYWIRPMQKWKAQVVCGGYLHNCGYFDTIEDAALAVEAAREVLHQEFARHA